MKKITKKGTAFAFENIMWMILALVGLLVLIFLIYKIGSGGGSSIKSILARLF